MREVLPPAVKPKGRKRCMYPTLRGKRCKNSSRVGWLCLFHAKRVRLGDLERAVKNCEWIKEHDDAAHCYDNREGA